MTHPFSIFQSLRKHAAMPTCEFYFHKKRKKELGLSKIENMML